MTDPMPSCPRCGLYLHVHGCTAEACRAPGNAALEVKPGWAPETDFYPAEPLASRIAREVPPCEPPAADELAAALRKVMGFLRVCLKTCGRDYGQECDDAVDEAEALLARIGGGS